MESQQGNHTKVRADGQSRQLVKESIERGNSVRQTALLLGLSVQGVYYHVNVLKAEGGLPGGRKVVAK